MRMILSFKPSKIWCLMEVSSYVALSGQMTLEQRMTTLSANIANANTPGFKAGIVNFKTLLANAGKEGNRLCRKCRKHVEMRQEG